MCENRPQSLTLLRVACLVLACAGAARASESDLTRLVPDDTLVYFGRAGSDQTDPLAAKTAYGRLTADPQVQRFTEQLGGLIDQLFEKQLAESEEDVATYRAAKGWFKTLLAKPTAVALLDVGVGEQGPFVEAAQISRIGPDAKEFLGRFDAFLAGCDAPEGEVALVAGRTMTRVDIPVPGGLYYGAIGDCFVAAIGEQAVKKIADRIGGKGSSLAKNEALVHARKRMVGDEAARSTTVHLNVADLATKLKPMMPMIPLYDPESAKKVCNVLTALGLDSLKAITWESRFAGDGCYSGMYFYTPGGGRGLLSNASDKALSDEDLKLIPKSPTWAVACNIDLSSLYRTLLAGVETCGEEVSGPVMGAIKTVEDALGFPLGEGLFDLVGDTVILYDAPENGGLWFTGITKLVESRDPAKLQKRVKRIAQTIAAAAGAEESVKFGEMEHRGHRVEFLNIVGIPMPVAPAWAAHDKWVVFGLYPQVVTTALDRLEGGDPAKESILANEDFVAARRVLGEIGPSMSYVDSRVILEGVYPWVLLLGQMGAAMAQGEGIEVDVTAIPSQQTLATHLFNEAKTTRCDEDGILYASYGAWPIGPSPLLSGYANTATVAMVASIALPSLSRARELSKRTVCAADLRGIGQAMYIYAQDDNKFPPGFDAVVKANYTTPRQFICPSTAATEADGLDACYVYIPGQRPDSNPTNVLVYEKPENHGGEGSNVLFVDGHVEFMTNDQVKRLVRETRERLAGEKKDREAE